MAKPSSKTSALKIRDHNLRLAMLCGLYREKLLPRGDLALFLETFRSFSDLDSLAEFDAIPVTATQLGRLRELAWPDDHDIPMASQAADPDDFEIADLAGLERCVALESIAILYAAIVDTKPLAALTQLRELTISSSYECGISDLEPLTHLAKLEKLSLANARITNLRPLLALPRLKSVSIEWASDVPSLGTLRSKSEPVLAELKRRKVKRDFGFPKPKR